MVLHYDLLLYNFNPKKVRLEGNKQSVRDGVIFFSFNPKKVRLKVKCYRLFNTFTKNN